MKKLKGAEPYFMGLDSGLTFLKAVIFDSQGREIACSREKIPVIQVHPGFMERDMDVLWMSVKKVIREVIKIASVDPRKIIGVSVTGHGDGLYLLDENGKPVRNAILSPDIRGLPILEEWKNKGILGDLYSIIGQIPFAGSPLPLLAWIKRNEPEVLHRTKHVMACKDYIKFRLTGKVCTDPTDASATLLNYKTGYPDPEIFELVNLTHCNELVSEIVEGWKECGRITKKVSSECGLGEETIVASGIHDIDASALGSGCINHGDACVILGTWGINEVISDKPVLDPDKECLTRFYGAPNKWLLILLNYTRAAGGSLEWFIRECGKDLEERAKEGNINPYSICDEDVMKIPSSSEDVLFFPEGVLGVCAAFYGISRYHTRAHLIRAIFEGVSYATKLSFEKLTRVISVKKIRVTGGGSRSPVWPQIMADVLGMPVEIPEGTELGAKGAAICAAIASGFYRSHEEALRNMTHVARVHNVNDNNKTIYERAYQKFLKLRESCIS